MRPGIADRARHNLARQGIRNVELRIGDGSGGVPDRAPYDAIIVSAAFASVPAPLTAQLRPGGRRKPRNADAYRVTPPDRG